MDKTKIPTKIYILSLLFLLHLTAVILENQFWGNLLSPTVFFFVSYIIYSSVLVKKELDKSKIYLFFFIFTVTWGFIDCSWFIGYNIFKIDVTATFIPYLYSICSVILTFQALFLYIKSLKQWNKLQLFIDVICISVSLCILMWSFFFSRATIEFELNITNISSFLYMLCDFITLTLYTLFYFSNRLKKTSIPFYYAFAGILIFVPSNFYYVYLNTVNLYAPNALLDATWTFMALLFAFSAYTRCLSPLKSRTPTIEKKIYPYNYGRYKDVPIIISIIILAFFIPVIGYKIFFAILAIVIFHIFSSKYIQYSIKLEYLLKKEKEMNENLEKIIEEKTRDLRKSNKILEDISNKDNLTGLYNRRYFLKSLLELVKNKNCIKFALLYMDVDRFKAINDSHGHELGDKILVCLSNRFKNHCKENCEVYRVGGDEFAILIKDYNDTKELQEKINMLLYITSESIAINPYLFNVNLSIGLSQYPLDARDTSTLLKYADMAMYEAKKSHNKQKYFFFDADLSYKMQRKNTIEIMLKNADFDNEFILYFQPQYRIYDNALVGMEALLRWIHPIHGVIPPGEFIPIAEETGLIFNLGEWVMTKAFEQIKKWNQHYKTNLQIGINISPMQIENPDFVNKISEKILDEQINPAWIDFEITEGVAMSSKILMEEVFSGLANIGISISIDDFGTGYSSLSYIKRFDIDRLKIDKELIDTIAEDKNTLLIIRAIIMMAKGLGLKTIAEGVEESNQMEILRALECDEIQGYLLGRPVPNHIFEAEHLDKML